MRILHCCLSCFYIDDYNYQENILPIINKEDGHEVKIIASTETYIDGKRLGYVKPRAYYTKEGINIVRLPYRRILPHWLVKKLRMYEGLKEEIESFTPDVILFHGASAYDLVTVAQYKKKNPNVRIYVDSHEDFNNSARSFISKYILHWCFYRIVLKSVLHEIEKMLFITLESRQFLHDFYGVEDSKLEFFPLGGRILKDEEYASNRRILRERHRISDNEILLIHSGKLTSGKRTLELIDAFINVKHSNLHLIVIGSAESEMELEIERRVGIDKRIEYLGWKTAEELNQYLCACDLYVQPGTQSVTMQNAVCSKCAVAIYPYKSHTYLLEDDAFYISSQLEIEKLLIEISEHREVLEEKRKLIGERANKMLDYRIIARAIY